MAAFPYYDTAGHRGAERPGRGAAEAVRRARLCPRRAVGAAAGGDFPGPLGRGNPPPHLHPDRSVGPRTVPAPRSHHSHLPQAVESRRSFPARICYNGLVFRHQPGEPHRPTQFFQAGVELLGLEDRAAGETEILSLAVEALRAAGLKDFSHAHRRSGAVRRAGGCAGRCRRNGAARLKRHFWRAGYVESLLYWLGHGDGRHKLPGTRAEIEALLDARGRCAAWRAARARRSSPAPWTAAAEAAPSAAGSARSPTPSPSCWIFPGRPKRRWPKSAPC